MISLKCENTLSFSSIGTQVEAEHVLNRLWIGKAQRGDSGNYSCPIPEHDPEDFPRAKVRVHVMDGKFDIVWKLFWELFWEIFLYDCFGSITY